MWPISSKLGIFHREDATTLARAPQSAAHAWIQPPPLPIPPDCVTRSRPLLLHVLRLDPDGKGKWVALAPELWRGPKALPVLPAAQAQHGLLSAVGSLRRAFLARESSLKHGSKAVVGEVPVIGGSIKRGFAFPYCLREERKLQHWGPWHGGWLDTSVRRGLMGARECGSIFAREYSTLRADGPHANGLKVGDPFLSPAAIVSRRRR